MVARWLGSLVALVLLAGPCGCGARAAAVREESVRFDGPDGARLAGTLFLPSDDGRHAAVVLFHGSGPQVRDTETGLWFAKHGLAALAYDKRGVGESSGDYRAVPFMDLCDDGLAAIAFLKRRGDIDAARIGVWGLSQGGWLGPLAASRSRDVRFVIAVSGPAVTPGEQMIFYYANQLRREGLSETDIAGASALRRQVWRYLSTHQDYAATREALTRSASQRWFPMLREQADRTFHAPTSEILRLTGIWYTREMNYDPTRALRQLDVPVLFLFGDRDEVTPVPASVAVLNAIRSEHPDRDTRIQIVAGADHVMTVDDASGRRVIAQEYLDTMAAWLRQHADSAAKGRSTRR